MELPEQIQAFREFLEVNEAYLKELHDQVRKGNAWITVQFTDLARHNPELAELLLEQPEDTLKAFQIAIDKMDLPRASDAEAPKVEPRIVDLPKQQYIEIRHIRSKHLERFIQIQGVVRQKSEVRPQMTSARFECPACGNVIPVLQLDQKFQEPTRCGCGRKGKFKLLSKELVDAQSITLEEAPEDLEGGEQPKRLKLFLKNDLVSPLTDKRTNPGTKLIAVGIVKEVPIVLQTGGQSTRFDLILEVNAIQSVQEDFTEINISPQDEQEIRELSQDPDLFEKLVASIAPNIYGHEPIKRALLLQLFGGVHKVRDRGVKARGDIHMLLIGDPGSGKSVLLKRVSSIAPKARFVSGKGASGAGLCVAPSSIILTNPGGMETIERVVEDRLNAPVPVTPEAWKQEGITDVKIQSLTHGLKLQSQHPAAIWKLKAPETVFVVTLTSGKRIELTGNTQLLALREGAPVWRRSAEIAVGEYVATPRALIPGDQERIATVDLIKSNPVVHDVKPFVRTLVRLLSKKHGGIRAAAMHLGVNENQLYHNWTNEAARGNIKLRSLEKLAMAAGVEWKERVRKISLYNGKIHQIPRCLDADVLYVAGLVAGDGDIRKSGSACSVRFSNGNAALRELVRLVFEEKFGLHTDTQPGSGRRPPSIRANSVILAETLFALGIPESPKSHRVALSNTLLHATNPLLASFLSGLYDADGSVSRCRTRGSDTIDLTTCSETLARQVQLVLLRFGIHARIRTRPPTTGKIVGRHPTWIVEIRSREQCRLFERHIPLQHPEKREALRELVKRETRGNTNVDIIPGVGKRVRELLRQHNIPLKKARWHLNYSRAGLQRVLERLPNIPEKLELRRLARSDIFWDRVKSVEEKEAPYEFVYDLTVNDSHNFVVDGVLVHNTAAVVRDDFLKGWALEAGALVLANRGLVCIDELDKMSDEDTSAMHEALEQQQVSISKANIQATLRCETTVLAAANPKFGRFDPYEIISKQIELSPALLSRFDLIFPVRDLPDKTKDERLASFILTRHKENLAMEEIIAPERMRKYIAYTRQRCFPRLTDAAIAEIKEYYVKMRGGNDTPQTETAIKPVPITARQLEALIRLAEASARMHLSERVTKRDAQRAIELVHYCLQQIGIDPDTGKFDLDRVTSGIGASQRSHIQIVKEILKELEERVGKAIPIEEVVREAGIRGVADSTTEDVIEKLKRSGDIYSPKHGFVSRT